MAYQTIKTRVRQGSHADRDTISWMLKRMGKAKLLNKQQELELGKQVQEWRFLEIEKRIGGSPSWDELCLEYYGERKAAKYSKSLWDAYGRQWTRNPSPQEEKTIVAKGQWAQEKLATANFKLVVSVATKYKNKGLAFEDLIQEGYMGLARAVEKFDPHQGYKFSTYSYWWIRQAVTRSIAEKSRTIRLPIHINEKLSKLRQLSERFQREHDCFPTPMELAKLMDPTKEGPELKDLADAIEQYKLLDRQPVALDKPAKTTEKHPDAIGDLVLVEQETPEDRLDQDDLEELTHKMLSYLNAQHRELMVLRYGIGTGEPMSLAQVGERFGFSRERARQIQTTATRNLRRVCEHNPEMTEALATLINR